MTNEIDSMITIAESALGYQLQPYQKDIIRSIFSGKQFVMINQPRSGKTMINKTVRYILDNLHPFGVD